MKKILALILCAILLCTALAACGGESSYSDLAIVDLGLEREYFGIAFRSGSDMTRKVEDITVELIADGLFDELSAKYEVGAVGKGDYTPVADPCEGSGDWEYIQNKGTLVIGITDYKPMDYLDDNGEWIGFANEPDQRIIYNILDFTEDSVTVSSYYKGEAEAFNSYTIVKTSKEGGHPKQILPSFFDSFVRFAGTVYGLFNNIGVYGDLKDAGFDVDFFEVVFNN